MAWDLLSIYERMRAPRPITYFIFLVLIMLSTAAHAKNIALGGNHTCAITDTGNLKCWGDNSSGQLGIGHNSPATLFNYYSPILDPQDVPVAVTAGWKHTCVLLKTGLVKCWGDNSSGQLGTGKISAVESTPVSVVALNGVKSIAAGAKHTCALYSWGFVKCWGSNQYGQLGNGKFTNSALPVAPPYLSSGLIDLAVGDRHTCVLMPNKSASCWGNNASGQLGNNSLINSATAVNTLLTKPATAIDAGNDHTCAIMTDKTVQCWGWNGRSQQGPKKYSGDNPAPITVAGLSNVGALALGSMHTCALDFIVANKPKLYCLGANHEAELGLGYATSNDIEKPTAVNIADPIMSVAAGEDHTCANTMVGGVPVLKCWGDNTFGQLGLDPQSPYLKVSLSNPSRKFSPTPVVITAIKVNTALIPLDTAPAPAIPASAAAPSPPPQKLNCIYTYSEWTACKLESWGPWQTRYPTSKNAANCVGEPVVGQSCTLPPPPAAPPMCETNQIWDSATQKCVCRPGQEEWFFWRPEKIIPVCGCTTQYADKDAAGKPIPWIGDKFAMVYFAGGIYKKDWAYRSDGLPVYQGPWHYVARNGTTHYVPGGYTMIADTQPWGVINPKKVYVSGQKMGTTWKACAAPQAPGGGGTPTVFTIEQMWGAKKGALDAGMTKLAQSAVTLAKAKDAFRQEIKTSLDPYLDQLLEKGAATPAPSGILASTKVAAVGTAQAQLEADFKSVITNIGAIAKAQGKPLPGNAAGDALLQASVNYLSAIFTVGYTPSVTGPACYADPIGQQLLYQYGTNALQKQTVVNAWASLAKLISDFHCMSIEQLNMFDKSFTAAFQYAVEMVGSTHPAYKTVIRDQLLQIYSPVIVNLYEVVRFEGEGVPVRSLVTLLWDRMKGIPDKTTLKTDSGMALEPTVFGLYNPETGKPEQMSAACTGTLNDYWITSCGLVFRSFVHALNNPSMDDFGSCPFWKTLRLGKPCIAPAATKTSKLKVPKTTVTAVLERLLIATAHANPFDNCESKGMDTDMCGKCVAKQPGGQDDAPKTQCEILCSQCTVPQGCITTLFCPFESKKMFCTKPVYAADGKTVACPGGPCMEAPCSDIQKAYGSCPNLPLCTDCSKCVHDNAVNTCKGKVQDCLALCSKNNGLTCTCGNWKIDAGEECDDGNMKNGDGCSATCKNTNVCGDGKVGPGEECDDGNKDNFDKCDNSCKNGAGICGDGIKDFDEKCDEGDKNGTSGGKCSPLCNLMCGNGLLDVDSGEECDTGKNTGWDGCNKECKKQAPVCGNSHIEKGETCDDGNTMGGDNCSSTCQFEKKYCDQCKYPNFKGKSAACDKYYAQMESSQKPGCTITSSPWDGSSCKLTPYKKGDPCWMQLPFSKPACQNDPAMVKCMSDCVANEGSIPPEVKLDCDQGPLKKKKSGSGYDAATLGEMKKIYNDNWDKAIQAFKLLAGDAMVSNTADAKNFGASIIDDIRPCTSDEISAFSIQTKGGAAGALYMPDKKEVCYNQSFINTISKTSAEKAIVHEAFHAVFDRIAEDAKKKPLKAECGFPDFYVGNAGGIDHWVFNVLSSNELIKNPLEPNGFNSVMCPKDN